MRWFSRKKEPEWHISEDALLTRARRGPAESIEYHTNAEVARTLRVVASWSPENIAEYKHQIRQLADYRDPSYNPPRQTRARMGKIKLNPDALRSDDSGQQSDRNQG